MPYSHGQGTPGGAKPQPRPEEGLEPAGRNSGGEASDRIECLIDKLGSREFAERRHAIEELETIGKPAVPALMESLTQPDSRLRWRAAKALVRIADPQAAPALVACLDDQDPGTRWVMAEALIALKRNALAALLEALVKQPDTYELEDAAHHVLHELIKHNPTDAELREIAEPVMHALEGHASGVRAPVAAAKALEKLGQTT